MPTPKSSTTTVKPKPTLEILPDTRFIVFAGDEHEANTIKLTGCVRLNCPEAMSISKPKIRLEGRRKISFMTFGSMTSGVTEDKRVFLSEERPLGSIDNTHKVNYGSIEWPFEFELAPTLPESVEGLGDTFIVYHLHASVSRPGWNQKDIIARTHLRIVRTLGSESIESTRSRINADIWSNKLSYSISIPTDAVIFGTSITADVELSPIKKGIKLGRVEMKLLETVVKRISNSPDSIDRNDRAKSEEAEVAKLQMDFPETAKVTFDDETVDNPVMADEMYRFQATLPLPKSLHKCRQDVDSHQINISHRFKLMVNIHNPEGHISQLVCRLPVKLFISPNLPINESNEVHVNNGTQSAIDSLTAGLVAPPQYGQHQLDQMYSDIDPNGYMSRAGSGSNTPAGMLAQSRRASDENLQSLSGVANGHISDHGSAVPAALHSRLTDLQISEPSAGLPIETASSSGVSSPRTHQGSPEDSRLLASSRNRSSVMFASSLQMSAEPSRRTSVDDQQHNLLHLDLDELSRVPTYNTALRTPVPNSTYDQPPSYIEAMSRPASPQQRPIPVQSTSDRSIQSSTTSPTSSQAGATDEEARLRSLRART